MIPTSLTSSSPPTACLGCINNQTNNSPTLSGCAKSNNGACVGMDTDLENVNRAALLGIASLILEGRALAEDEYATPPARLELKTSLSGGNLECGRQSPKPSTSRAAFGENLSNVMANSSLSIDVANYLGRKSSRSPETSSQALFKEYYNSSSSESASSSVESNHSRWSQKLSQLRQESPIAHHQAMPAGQKVAVECPRGSDAEYVALAINTDHRHQYAMSEDKKGADFEILRRMSLNQMNFYNSPNSMTSGGGVSGGSGSSENFMCSLQSLASNTCMRVGTPLLLTTTSPSSKYLNKRQISSSTSRCTAPPCQEQQQLDYSTNNFSTEDSGRRSSNSSWYASASPYSANSNSSNKIKAVSITDRMSKPSAKFANNRNLNSSTSSHNLQANIFGRKATPTTTTTLNTTTGRNKTHPQQGPHCDQFLKKMGLAKGDASEVEEHKCDISDVSRTCTRWRAYRSKMEGILSNGGPLCIEVFLGPFNDKMLLEQWIITQKEKQPPPTMTLPSLCSAIRSQLYFSQISAWCDLIKKSDKTINETGRVIFATPTTTSAAGDLATTTNSAKTTAPTATSTTSTHHHTTTDTLTLSTSSASVGCGSVGGFGGAATAGVGCDKKRLPAPRLNIFYRIKRYDSSACFNSTPNVHNFPNVNISENCSISVCLKSLPRLAGGIPKVGTTATETTMQQQNSPTATTRSLVTTTPTATTLPTVNSQTSMECLAGKKKTLNAAIAKANASTSASTKAATVAVNVAAIAANTTTTAKTNANKSTIFKMNCDNNLKEHQQQQKPFTASNSSSSSRCFYSINKNNSKTSFGEIENDRPGLQGLGDVKFECCNEKQKNTIDLSAGGDNTNISFGSDVMGDGTASVGDCDSSNSSLSTNNYGNLSHREKQLLKYRKRMLKRDKKQQLRITNDNFCSNNQMEISAQERFDNNNYCCNKMEQEEADENDFDCDGGLNVDVENDNPYDDDDNVGNNSDTADCSARNHSVNNSLANGQRQQKQLPKIHKNSIPYTNQNQQHHVKMISTGTQTITNTCTSCGSEKSMICLKCNPLKSYNDGDNDNDGDVEAEADEDIVVTTTGTSLTVSSYNYEEMDAETSSSASSLSSSDIIYVPRNKAELLLQAIQRTPKSNKKHKHKSKDSNQMAAIKHQQQQHQQNSPTAAIPTTTLKNSNNKNLRNSPQNSNPLNSDNRSISHSNSRNSSTSSIMNNGAIVNNSSSNNMIGCQVCKRQKTQHNFTQPTSEDVTSDEGNSVPNGSLNSSSSPSCGNALIASKATNQNQTRSDDEKAVDDGDDNEKDGGKNPSADSVDNVSIVIDDCGNEAATKMSTTKSCDNLNQSEVMEEEYFETSTKLTPQIDRCSLNAKTSSYYAQTTKSNLAGANGANNMEYSSPSCTTPPLDEQKENSSINEGGTTMFFQFKTPSPSEHQNDVKSKNVQPLQPHKHTPKPNLLHIACNFNKTNEQQISKLSHNNSNLNNAPATQNPLLLRRSLPKVNLTPIFCNTSNSIMPVTSSPIPIGNGVCNGSPSKGLTTKSAEINVTQASPTFSFESPSGPAPSITVQKSNSAPTLPNSPSLSPRFIKATAIYKRRSRHLSDRSDRSSLGSDEQISDEDIDSGMYSPFATSPVKLRTRLAAVFGRKPLLGNLEECLLQRRLVPKIEVMGFKLLLGASGGFCPTQLTIPAAAYFYELKGETLSTPYLCEIRLPRKGYTVPRSGTVQATLLNPMGTVVRMFVIPYDMRDMPSLHQTFIRQRILADTGVQTNNENPQNGLNKEYNDVISGNYESSSKLSKHQKMEPRQPEKQLHEQPSTSQQQRSPQSNNEQHLGHFISAENMKSLRYSIHLRFQTSRTGRLMLHTDIRLLISRRTDCDTAAAHAKGVLEAPNELITNTMMPTNPKYSARQDQTSSKI